MNVKGYLAILAIAMTTSACKLKYDRTPEKKAPVAVEEKKQKTETQGTKSAVFTGMKYAQSILDFEKVISSAAETLKIVIEVEDESIDVSQAIVLRSKSDVITNLERIKKSAESFVEKYGDLSKCEDIGNDDICLAIIKEDHATKIAEKKTVIKLIDAAIAEIKKSEQVVVIAATTASVNALKDTVAELPEVIRDTCNGVVDFKADLVEGPFTVDREGLDGSSEEDILELITVLDKARVYLQEMKRISADDQAYEVEEDRIESIVGGVAEARAEEIAKLLAELRELVK